MASSSTHESPEAEFSHLDDIEEFMVAYAEKVDEMLEQQAAPRAPSTETAVASASPRVDYEFLRNSLAAFFLERIETGKWTLHGNLPRKGSDKELDAKLVELKLQSKRDYVSRRWLILKKSKGIHPPPILDLNSDEIFDRYMMVLSTMIDHIINKAVAATVRQCAGSNFATFATICGDEKVKTLLKIELESFTEGLSETLATCTPTNLDIRVAKFEYQVRHQQRKAFLAKVKETIAPDQTDDNKISFNCFFCCLHLHLLDAWNGALDCSAAAPLIMEITPERLAELLEGSEETLYYIAGYLLDKMQKYVDRLKKIESRKGDASFWRVFVDYNLAENRPGRLLPDAVVKKRETTVGALVSASSNWFDFVRLLEGLFLVNVTPEQARQRKGRIFNDIGLEVGRSGMLQRAFLGCIPIQLERDEKREVIRLYKELIIPCFTKLKCRDVLRILRSTRPADAMNTLSLRKRVMFKSTKKPT